MPKSKRKHSRSNGQGSLERRNGIYLARWTVNGIRHSRSTGCTVLSEAEKKLAEFTRPTQIKDEIERYENLQAKIATGKERLKAIENLKRRVKIADALEVYFQRGNSINASQVTKDKYANRYNVFLEWVNANCRDVVWMSDFTLTYAEKFIDHIRKTDSANSFNSKLALLKSLWKALDQNENVFESFKSKKLVTAERRDLTISEMSSLLEACGSKYKSQVKMMFFIAMNTGFRLSDCSMLRYSEVDIVRRIITIVPMKTRAHGTKVIMPISDALFNAFSKWKRVDDSDFILPKMKKYWESGHIQYIVRNVFKKAGIATYVKDKVKDQVTIAGFHSIRHTWASLQANGNPPMPVFMLMKLMGHTSPDMTKRYYHSDIEDARKFFSSSVQLTMK